MPTENEQKPTADEGPVERMVRPSAWLYENMAGALAVHTNTERVRFEADMRAAREHPEAHSMTPLYDQTAIDAAVAAERERCASVCEGVREIADHAARDGHRKAGAMASAALCAKLIRA